MTYTTTKIQTLIDVIKGPKELGGPDMVTRILDNFAGAPTEDQIYQAIKPPFPWSKNEMGFDVIAIPSVINPSPTPEDDAEAKARRAAYLLQEEIPQIFPFPPIKNPDPEHITSLDKLPPHKQYNILFDLAYMSEGVEGPLIVENLENLTTYGKILFADRTPDTPTGDDHTSYTIAINRGIPEPPEEPLFPIPFSPNLPQYIIIDELAGRQMFWYGDVSPPVFEDILKVTKVEGIIEGTPVEEIAQKLGNVLIEAKSALEDYIDYEYGLPLFSAVRVEGNEITVKHSELGIINSSSGTSSITLTPITTIDTPSFSQRQTTELRKAKVAATPTKSGQDQKKDSFKPMVEGIVNEVVQQTVSLLIPSILSELQGHLNLDVNVAIENHEVLDPFTHDINTGGSSLTVDSTIPNI
jgi:hypothetical protein